MYAFTVPTPPPLTARSALRRRAACSRVAWRACAASPRDDVLAAIREGQQLRDRLDELSESRRAQAERTNSALEQMANKISEINAKLRADAGMPPVAESPVTSAAAAAAAAAPPDLAAASRAESAPPDVPDDDASAASDEPYMDPKNFGYESTAGWQVLQASDELPENEGNLQFRIECDMHGCSLIQVKGDAPPGPGVRQNYVQSGARFRVGYDPEAPKSFCAMVGNDQWLIALSYDEIRHFKRLCLSLQKRMDRIGRGEEDPPVKKPAVRRSGDGMFNMRVARAGLDFSVEHESKLVWVQAIGQPSLGQYCIRAIFMEGRQSECFWARETVPNLLAALNNLGVE
ncbi:hypothetical protein BWQ96_09048 [Gracilariopsis chorda]|uniref:Uncharacterized protein n=1 Tax=Gracilariopsis chorda TaxID=448386 RepID=A0A2V3IGM0_9FLOR|nr:hypothetical protein BWQ96_09048 [Gracilariopsis chorda]|eukprot:PXF41234.1 hypothetical protein BWQ96_09048 [Gracilariopsis chorda]